MVVREKHSPEQLAYATYHYLQKAAELADSVPRDENGSLARQDFFELWEPFGEAEEHTINSIIEFEDAYYKGYITFGDKYQPPIVVGDKFRWTPILYHSWLWESPVYLIEDLPGVYRRQFNYALGQVDHPDPTIEDIEWLEERFTAEGYSIAKDTQPVIEITSSPITSTET